MHRLKWEWDSITTFNQFVASFVHSLRSKMSEVLTLQLRILKLGARVQECKDRIKISLPSSCPVAPILRRCVTLLGLVRLTSQAL